MDLERRFVLLLQDAKQAQGIYHVIVGDRSILYHAIPFGFQVMSCCDGGDGVVLLLETL